MFWLLKRTACSSHCIQTKQFLSNSIMAYNDLYFFSKYYIIFMGESFQDFEADITQKMLNRLILIASLVLFQSK